MEGNERLQASDADKKQKLNTEQNQLLSSLQARISTHQLNQGQTSNTNLKTETKEQAARRKTNLAKHMLIAIDTLKKGPKDDPNSTTTDSMTRRKTRVGNRVSVFMSDNTNSGPPGTYTRRVSNYGATGPLAGRNSVNVRKTSVVLTKFDEGMPIGGARNECGTISLYLVF